MWEVKHPWVDKGNHMIFTLFFEREESAVNYAQEIIESDMSGMLDDETVLIDPLPDPPGGTGAFYGLPPAKIHYTKGVVLDENLRPLQDPYSDVAIYFDHLDYDKELYPAYEEEDVYEEMNLIFNSRGETRIILRMEGPSFGQIEDTFDTLFEKMKKMDLEQLKNEVFKIREIPL